MGSKFKFLQGKNHRKDAHKAINDYLENAKKNLEKAEERYKLAHKIIQTIPLPIWNLGAWMGWNLDTIYLDLPWDWNKVEEFSKIMKEAGWKQVWEADDVNKENKYFRWRHNDANYSFLCVYVSIKAKHPESKCVLIPLKVEKKDVVTAYDHICPDEHPELFKTNENGILVYIGDNVFPAIEVKPE